MKSKFWRERKRTNRIISSALVGLMVFSTPITSFAATKVYAPQPLDVRFYGSAYKDLQKAFGTNEDALKNHYYTYGKKEGRAANLTEAIAKNQVMNMIVAFVEYNRDYYLSHGLETNFPYFNVDAYLAANPDVAELVGNDRYKALLHYLDYGIYEGRSCETGFDPAVAIVAQTDSLSASGLSIPEVFASYKAATGVANTSGIRLGVTDRNVLAVKWVCPCAPTADKTKVDSYFKGEIQKVSNVANVVFENNSESSQDSSNGESKQNSYEKEDKPIIPAPVKKSPKSYTMMVYMVGTDLERNYGQATDTVLDLCQAVGLSDDNLNVLLCAGGTKEWKKVNTMFAEQNNGKTVVYQLNHVALKNAWESMKKQYAPNMDLNEFIANADEVITNYLKDNSSDMNAIDEQKLGIMSHYLITENTVEMKADFADAPMGSSDTLSTFMNLSLSMPGASADMYGLSFWNHGGGVVGEICVDEVNTSAGGLTIAEIKNAFEKSKVVSAENKLSMLAFDACLMGSTEIAYYLKDYYDFMLGSETFSYGALAYEDTLPTISRWLKEQEKSKTELSRDAIQDMLNDTAQKLNDEQANITTWATYDSNSIDYVAKSIDALAYQLNAAVKSGAFPNEIYEAINHAEKMSYQMNKGVGASSFSYVDALNFLLKLQSELNNNLKADSQEYPEVQKMYIRDIESAIKQAIEATKMATSGFVLQYYGDKANPDGEPTFITTSGNIVSTLFDALQEKNLKNNLVGTTIYVPIADNDYEDLLKQYESYFGNDANWDSYATLMENYFVNYLQSENEVNRREALREKVDYNEIFDTVKFDTVGKIEDSEFIPIKYFTAVFKDEYSEDSSNKDIRYTSEEEQKNASSGNPYYDFMDAAKTVQVYVARKYDVIKTTIPTSDGENKTSEQVEPESVIIGNLDIGKQNVGTYIDEKGNEHTAINVMKDTLNQAKGYLVTGVKDAVSGNTVERVLDWAQKYALENSTLNKIARVLGLVSSEDEGDYSENVAAFAGTAYERDEQNALREIDRAEGAKRYLVFQKKDDSYTYVGTVDHDEAQAVEDQYKTQESSAVSFYHYVVGDNRIECLEQKGDSTTSYSIKDAPIYDVSTENNQDKDKLTIGERYIGMDSENTDKVYNEYLLGANDLIESGGAFTSMIATETKEVQEITKDTTIGATIDAELSGIYEESLDSQIGVKADGNKEEVLETADSKCEDNYGFDDTVVEWVDSVVLDASNQSSEVDTAEENVDGEDSIITNPEGNGNDSITGDDSIEKADSISEVSATQELLTNNLEDVELGNPVDSEENSDVDIPEEVEAVMPEQDMSYEIVVETENQTEPPVQEDNSATSETESTPAEQTVSEEANVSSDEEDV